MATPPSILETVGGVILGEPVSDEDRRPVDYLIAIPQVFNERHQAWFDLTFDFRDYTPSIRVEKAHDIAKDFAEGTDLRTRVITYAPYVTYDSGVK